MIQLPLIEPHLHYSRIQLQKDYMVEKELTFMQNKEYIQRSKTCLNQHRIKLNFFLNSCHSETGTMAKIHQKRRKHVCLFISQEIAFFLL
jgi:hypothetical protein